MPTTALQAFGRRLEYWRAIPSEVPEAFLHWLVWPVVRAWAVCLERTYLQRTASSAGPACHGC